jgi:hypothetical protein
MGQAYVVLLVCSVAVAACLGYVYFLPLLSAWNRRRATPVEVTVKGLRREFGFNKCEEIDWVDVEEVWIVVTSGGPWSEDVFFAFLDVRRSGVLVPQRRAPAGFLESMRGQFPDLDQKAFINAMACTAGGKFLIWKRALKEQT